MSVQPCLICQNDEASAVLAGNDLYRINCEGCGSFLMTGSATRMLSGTPFAPGHQTANARGWLRENPGVTVNSQDIPRLASLQTPSVGERAEKLLASIVRTNPEIGAVTTVLNHNKSPIFWCAVSWSASRNEVHYLVREYLARTKGWLIEVSASQGNLLVQVSPAGYDHLESLRHSGGALDSGFCAMWFNEEVKVIWTEAIEPSIKMAGYNAIRIDGVEHNNKIDDEILSNIRRSRFVVADFTGERGGVYFEAGFALGLGRQVIWTVREDALDNVHFDNRQYNFIVWKADDLGEFAKRLRLRIEATVGRGPL